jgi:hypothetical protein
MSAWVLTILSNRIFVIFGVYHEPDVKQVTNTTGQARCNSVFMVNSYIISHPINAQFRNVLNTHFEAETFQTQMKGASCFTEMVGVLRLQRFA